MGKRVTTNDFIERAKSVHGDKYDYSLVDYKKSAIKVKMICKIHGIFEQTPNAHLSNHGCDLCGIKYNSDKKRLTLGQFVKKAMEIHGDKYDYSLVEYNTHMKIVKIVCDEHGIFEQLPNCHLRGQGCPVCGKIKSDKNKMNLIDDLIFEFSGIHNNKYDYALVNYVGMLTNIKITCPTHGEFKQLPSNHIRGAGCPKCKIEYLRSISAKSKDDFVKDAILIHGNKYDYSLVEYENSKIKVKIICHTHGIFEQTPDTHVCGESGCPECRNSKGEFKIEQFLINNNIEYRCQFRFLDCVNKRSLPFDFYIKDKNVTIEYDGSQHYVPVEYFGGVCALLETQHNDEIKNKYCKNNNIKLIRIPYFEFDNIENILTSELLNGQF